ncbi:DUF1284 domain-containing protein [Methanobrevibacter sp. 87.7]|uniref:DUF1284 domain-containing protein n=1 Tax=Methanobrevibacter sp. 87.7 TaxID=387957 RepID=UPI000B500378|nr:DUF1284 domain-containing protein [Methanobrevibacter sp. 87.7]
MLKIRGHHLLCLQGFQGYGYNKEFTENMTLIHKKIINDEEYVKITSNIDDICKKCPNNNCEICINKDENTKILKMDKIVLEKILKESKKDYYKASELFDLINNKLFTSKKDIENICGGCKWYDVCLWAKQKE